MTYVAYLAAFFSGACLAVAFSINSRLGRVLGSPLRAAGLACAIAVSFLLLLSLAMRESLPAWRGLAEVPWYAWTGGLIGAGYMGSTVLLMHRLGAATIGAGQIAGQMLGSVVMDAFGWFGVPVRPLETSAMTGCVLALVGVALIRRGPAGGPSGASGSRGAHVLLLGLVVFLGMLMPVQGGINATLREALERPLLASAIQFMVASLALLAAALLVERRRPPAWHEAARGPWWMWLGGLFAASYVTGVMLTITVIGASGTLGLAVAGQQICAALIDQTGAFGLARRPITRLRVGGIVLLLGGVVVIQFS